MGVSHLILHHHKLSYVFLLLAHHRSVNNLFYVNWENLLNITRCTCILNALAISDMGTLGRCDNSIVLFFLLADVAGPCLVCL